MSCSFIESPNVYPSLTSHFPHGLLATRCGQCDVCNAGRANIFWSSMASKDGPRDLQPVSGSTSQGIWFPFCIFVWRLLWNRTRHGKRSSFDCEVSSAANSCASVILIQVKKTQQLQHHRMHISHSVHLTCISLAGRLDPLKVSAPKKCTWWEGACGLANILWGFCVARGTFSMQSGPSGTASWTQSR